MRKKIKIKSRFCYFTASTITQSESEISIKPPNIMDFPGYFTFYSSVEVWGDREFYSFSRKIKGLIITPTR